MGAAGLRGAGAAAVGMIGFLRARVSENCSLLFVTVIVYLLFLCLESSTMWYLTAGQCKRQWLYS